MEILPTILHHEHSQLPIRVFLLAGGMDVHVHTRSTILINAQTKGKTLEEIDYVFASAEARVRMEERFARAVERTDNSGFDSSQKGSTLELEKQV